MPFPYLHASIPASVKSTFAQSFLKMRRHELSERARLLRRLGYSQKEALQRCQAYEAGEYEPFHSSPLANEVKKIVEEVYQPESGRVTSLAPGS